MIPLTHAPVCIHFTRVTESLRARRRDVKGVIVRQRKGRKGEGKQSRPSDLEAKAKRKKKPVTV